MEASTQVPEAILKLIEKYEFHQAADKRGQFNETQLRREFVDPFFKTLGWDVDNSQGNSELYKEVIHEDPIRIRGSTEFIDYALGGSVGLLKTYPKFPSAPSTSLTPLIKPGMIKWSPWSSGCLPSISRGPK